MNARFLQAVAACDSEPIHTPGSVQPYGILLVADVARLQVRHVAGDAERTLGVDQFIGRHLAALVGAEIASRAAGLTVAPVSGSSFLGQLTSASGQLLDVSGFVTGANVVVELEPASTSVVTALTVLGQLEQAAAVFERTTSLVALCEQAVSTFRDLTGFDRVMIYRFDENGSGRVLAEARRPDTHAFLNHHFPASDIPQQARAVRSQPDPRNPGCNLPSCSPAPRLDGRDPA